MIKSIRRLRHYTWYGLLMLIWHPVSCIRVGLVRSGSSIKEAITGLTLL